MWLNMEKRRAYYWVQTKNKFCLVSVSDMGRSCHSTERDEEQRGAYQLHHSGSTVLA